MPPPPSYLDITSVPYSRVITQSEFNSGTFGGVANEVWLRYVAATPIALGMQVTSGGTFVPRTGVFASDGTTVVQPAFAGSTGMWANLATASTYYVRIRRQPAGASDFDFTANFDTFPMDDFTLEDGDYIINDDLDRPGVVVAADGTLKSFISGIPGGEMGAILPNGITIWHDRFGRYGSDKIAVLDASLQLIGTVNAGVTGVNFPRFAADATQFYVFNQNGELWTVSEAAVATNTGYTSPGGFNEPWAFGVGESTIYWTERNSSDGTIHTIDLDTLIDGADLYTVPGFSGGDTIGTTANLHPGELLVLPDGTLVTYWADSSLNYRLIHVSAAGALLHDISYTYPTQIDHIQVIGGESGAIKIWLYTTDGLDTGHFGTLTFSTGLITDDFTNPLFEDGQNMQPGSTEMFGISTSCAMLFFGAGEEEEECRPLPPEAQEPDDEDTDCIELEEDDDRVTCDCPEWNPAPHEPGVPNPLANTIRWSDQWGEGHTTIEWLDINYHFVDQVEFDVAPDPVGVERPMLFSTNPHGGLTRGIGVQPPFSSPRAEQPGTPNPYYGTPNGQTGAAGMVLWPTTCLPGTPILLEVWGDPQGGPETATDGEPGPRTLIALRTYDTSTPGIPQDLALYIAGSVYRRNQAYPLDAGMASPDVPPETPGTGQIVTVSATRVSDYSEWLTGAGDPEGVASFGFFRYGVLSDLSGAAVTPQVPLGAGTTPVTFNDLITPLQPHTLYYYQAVMINGTTTLYGDIRSFLTGGIGPVAATGPIRGNWQRTGMVGLLTTEEWHKVELKWKISTYTPADSVHSPNTAAADGWVEVWVDGVKMMHLQEIQFLLEPQDDRPVQHKTYWDGVEYRPMGWLACLYLSDRNRCVEALPGFDVDVDRCCEQLPPNEAGALGGVPAILVGVADCGDAQLTLVGGIDTPEQNNDEQPIATGFVFAGGNIPAGNATWYRVTAVLNGQESSWSENIELFSDVAHSDRIEWEPPSQGADSYRVYQLLNPDTVLHQDMGGVLREETYYVTEVPGTQTKGVNDHFPDSTAAHWWEFSAQRQGAAHVAALYVDPPGRYTYVIAGHTLKEIEDVYAFVYPEATVSLTLDPMTGELGGGTSAEAGVFTRLREGIDYTQSVVEKGSGRFHVIEITARLRDPSGCTIQPVTVNVSGIEDVGDGSGELVEQGALILEHFLLNWVFNHYETGAWFQDTEFAPGLVARDSYAAAAAYAATLIPGGYIGAVWLGEFAEVRQLILEAITSYNLMFFYRNALENSFGAWAVAMFDTRFIGEDEGDDQLYDQFDDMLKDTFSTGVTLELTANVIPYLAGPNYTGTGGWIINGRQSDEGSIDKTWGRVERVLELKWTRLISVATDVVASQLNLRSNPITIGEFQTKGRGMLTEPGSRFRINHDDAPDGGWHERLCLVIGNDLDLDTGITTVRFISTPSMRPF